MKEIAIIGGGFCGTMLAINLIKNGKGNIKIRIFEKNKAIGYGIAYSTKEDNHLYYSS